MEDLTHCYSDHGGPSIRPILTTLLLLEPSALAPSKLSSDLLMRQRLLGLSPTAPHTYDVEFASASLDPSADDEVVRSQQNFVSGLSRPPFELCMQCLDVAATARCLFALRSKALHDAANADVDPIDLNKFHAWCSNNDHNQSHDMMMVRCPTVIPSGEDCLWVELKEEDDGEWKLANLFALNSVDQQKLTDRFHRRTGDCRRMHQQSRRMREGNEEEGGAEYINDANDFWDGFSDEEEQGRDVDEAPRTGDVLHPALDLQPGDGAPASMTAQEAAIKDIICGAYTLHRSARATGSHRDSEEAFMALVQSAISTAGT